MTNKLWMSMLSVSAFALAGLMATSQANAAACDISVEATDAMAFSTKAIEVPKSCKDFTINLKHVGSLGKNVMGHNLVITKDSDQKSVLEDGSAAGAASNFVKEDARIVAHTKIIGGGESTSTKVTVSKLNAKDNYVFFCSFPGHAMMMKGTVKLI